MYRPFFRQKEFLTESRLLLSSRAGKLLSSKLIISLWPRAPDLALFPEVRGRWTPFGLWPPLSHTTSHQAGLSPLSLGRVETKIRG